MFKKLFEKLEARRMWKEIIKRKIEILEQNKVNTMSLLMGYIQRQELEKTGLLMTIPELKRQARIFYNNLREIGLVDETNKPLESVLENLRG